MKKIVTLLSLLISSSFCLAQSPALSFDGVNDFVDLGSSVSNNVRTVEFWFKLTQSIDPSISHHMVICSREVSPTNINEWHVLFTAGGQGSNPGALRFAIVDTVHVGIYDVESDATSWNANQWYHVAGVVHPIDGMYLFIDGILQQDTQPTRTAPPVSMPNHNFEIGRHQTFSNRYFNGTIEDFHLATTALYTTNFIPPCPIVQGPTTIGLWSLNQGAGSVAFDSSPNAMNGNIVGAQWTTSFICGEPNSIDDLNVNNQLRIFPNPSQGNFQFSLETEGTDKGEIEVHNKLGQLIRAQSFTSKSFSLDLTDFANGIYFYRLRTSDNSFANGTIVKE